MSGVIGIVLAAGAGRRMGAPKALIRTEDGDSWAARAAQVLTEGGCCRVLVVLGAEAEAVAASLPDGIDTTVARDWQKGMGWSLASGIRAAQALGGAPTAAVVHLVDLPGVTAGAVKRLIGIADRSISVLARATYSGVPGHPVVIGWAHWNHVLARSVGDRGAQAYLADVGCLDVECGDLADGRDVDTPAALHAAGSLSVSRHRDLATTDGADRCSSSPDRTHGV